MTILQNCTLAPRLIKEIPRKEAEELAMRYFERFRIRKKALFCPSQLSGGQQQRIAIARSLCMNPQVMLLVGTRSRIDERGLETMGQLAADGMTSICVVHEMGFARRVADRGYLHGLGEGREDCLTR